MSAGKDFLYDTLKYIPLKVMPGVSGVLTLFFLTKKGIVDTTTYVDYTFIAATLIIFAQIVGGWVNSSVMYFYTSFTNKEEKESFIINISFLQLFFVVFGVVGLFLTAMLTIKSSITAVLIVFILVLQIYLNYSNSFLQVKRDIKTQLIVTFIQAISQILGLVLCYYFFKGSLEYFFFFLLISYINSALFVIWKKKAPLCFNLTESFDLPYCKKILSYGLPICLWFFSTQLYQIGDRVLFKYFNLTKNVGNYVSFRDLSVGLSSLIAMPLLFASYPMIMQLSQKKENKTIVEQLLRRNIIIITLVFLPLLGIVYFKGELLVKLIVGEEYLLSPLLMVIVLLTILLGIISIYLQKGIEVKGNTLLMFKISMLVAAFSITLNFVLIKEYGVISSIFISLFSHLLYCVSVYFYSRKVFRIFL